MYRAGFAKPKWLCGSVIPTRRSIVRKPGIRVALSMRW